MDGGRAAAGQDEFYDLAGERLRLLTRSGAVHGGPGGHGDRAAGAVQFDGLPTGQARGLLVLIVPIGAAGSGKSTWAGTWPRTQQVLEFDQFRVMISDNLSRQGTPGDAANVLKLIPERRMARKLNTVIDATSLMVQRVQGLAGGVNEWADANCPGSGVSGDPTTRRCSGRAGDWCRRWTARVPRRRASG
ncbi:AAA family ATPase [Streptomyces sp. QTS137]